MLLGFSRGGLYALRYAGLYPERTGALYLAAPVLDIRSWPGWRGNGLGSPAEWRDCLGVHGLGGRRAAGVALPRARRRGAHDPQARRGSSPARPADAAPIVAFLLRQAEQTAALPET